MIDENTEVRTCWGCGTQFLADKRKSQRYHALSCFKNTVVTEKQKGNGSYGNRIEKFYR